MSDLFTGPDWLKNKHRLERTAGKISKLMQAAESVAAAKNYAVLDRDDASYEHLHGIENHLRELAVDAMLPKVSGVIDSAHIATNAVKSR